jgi:hypothetical protein
LDGNRAFAVCVDVDSSVILGPIAELGAYKSPTFLRQLAETEQESKTVKLTPDMRQAQRKGPTSRMKTVTMGIALALSCTTNKV